MATCRTAARGGEARDPRRPESWECEIWLPREPRAGGNLGLLLVTDSQDPNPNGTDVFGIGAQLLVDFFAATEIYGLDMPSDALGYGSTDSPLPANAGLVGKKYYAQVLWAWPGGSCSLPPFNLSMTSGVEITIQ